ncbi:MAG: hypothetical protein HY739_11955 [Desulfobacterales bacterium]|nr:hypothetical protein [Desulfobacterales bacterium]
MRQLSSELLISPSLRCGENQEFETDALRALLNCRIMRRIRYDKHDKNNSNKTQCSDRNNANSVVAAANPKGTVAISLTLNSSKFSTQINPIAVGIIHVRKSNIVDIGYPKSQ